MNIPNQIPVTVLTGFLGSGKTTLLKSLLKSTEMDNVAVIINEFGEVGLDHLLVDYSEENIVELQNGCICCTIRGDLSETLMDLHSRMLKGKIKYYDRVIIETTGLADPVPIIHTLMTSIDVIRCYSLDGVITVVDGVNGENTLKLQIEAEKQAALAERIIISKTDLIDKRKEEMLVNRLKIINPSVSITSSAFGNLPSSELFGFGAYDPYDKSKDVKKWLAAEKLDLHHNHDHDHDHDHVDVNRHDENIQAFALTHDKPINMTVFMMFVELLTEEMGPDLLRVKGIINIEDRDCPAVIHGVQHIFHPVLWLDKWPDGNRLTKLVFITRNINKEGLEKFFKAFTG